jgi:hypothetical protein
LQRLARAEQRIDGAKDLIIAALKRTALGRTTYFVEVDRIRHTAR